MAAEEKRMSYKEWNDIGKEIRNVVQNAVDSKDFAELNRQITDSVNEALCEIQNAFKDSVSSGRTEQKTKQSSQSAKNSQTAKQGQNDDMRRHAQAETQHVREEGKRVRNKLYHRADVIAQRPKGRVSNVLYTVFGSVLLGLGVLLSLLFSTIAMTGEIELTALWVLVGLVIGPIGGCGIGMLIRGAGDRGRLERFDIYKKCIGGKDYLKISDMAAAVRKSEKYVRRDLKKMIALGMFPQGHINELENLFILDHETFAEYETMRQEVEQRSRTMKAETPAQRAASRDDGAGSGLLKGDSQGERRDPWSGDFGEVIPSGKGRGSNL